MAKNKRIVQLKPKATITGNMLLAAYDPLTDTTYKVRVDQVAPGTEGQQFAWNASVSYDENDVTVQDDQLWISQQDNNLGVLPGTDVAFWLPGDRSYGSGLVIYQPGIFIEEVVTVLRQVGDYYYLHILVSETRPYNSIDIETETADGDWRMVSKPYQVSVPSSGGTIEMDAHRIFDVCFAIDTITANKIWELDNIGEKGTILFKITGGELEQTFPDNWRVANSSNALYDSTSKIWIPQADGDYEAHYQVRGTEEDSDGQTVGVKIFGPFE